MKYWIAFASSILAAAVLLSFLPVHGEAAVYRDVLRLHVIAESDSAEDQARKLAVRDAVLDCLAPALEGCSSHEEARRIVTENLPRIQTAAETTLEQHGSDCAVTLLLGRESYPRRDYGGAVLPAGIYDSLRVVLGEGAGHNWWCVLFPTVCVRFAKAGEEEYLAAGFTPEEYRIITGTDGPWKVRFRLLELAEELAERLKSGITRPNPSET